MRLPHQNSGLTLIELLITISIIIMISVLSYPMLRRYQPNLQLNSYSRQITADLRYAQQQTVTEQVPNIFEMDQASGRYYILRGGEATTTVKTVELPEGIIFNQINGLTDNRVIFNYYGGVNESGVIILSNDEGVQKTINIKPSGYIELEQ